MGEENYREADRASGTGPGNDGAPGEINAKKAAEMLGLGWNLGNSYDCHGTWFDNVRMETAWGNPIVTRDLIHFVAQTGFSTVRVPVTWYMHMDENGVIAEDWIKRVRRTVRMILAEGMCCILDCKHDCGAMVSYGGGWIQATRENFTKNRERVQRMITQIASCFAEEPQTLLFEGLSECMNAECEQFMPSQEETEVVNDWNQLFVDTVRGTGGNNAVRNLIVTPYASGATPYLLSGFRVPKDTAEKRLLLGVHLYVPLGFTSRAATWARQTDEFDCLCEEELERAFDDIVSGAEPFGLPVVITEFGAMDRSNTPERARYCGCVVDFAHSRGIPCMYWDDGKGYEVIRRAEREVRFPGIVAAMMTAERLTPSGLF